MLAIVRQKEITNIVKENGKVIVKELARNFSVTEETIRRDLDKLVKDGIVIKSYGGAILANTINTSPIVEDNRPTSTKISLADNFDFNESVATLIANNIENGETILLDNSKFSLKLTEFLMLLNKQITILTNSLDILIKLQESSQIKVIIAGGSYNPTTRSFEKKWTKNIIKNYYFNKAILSCDGIDAKRGLSCKNEDEAEIKKSMLDSCTEVHLIAPQEILSKPSHVKFSDLDSITHLYVSGNLDASLQNALRENETKIINVNI